MALLLLIVQNLSETAITGQPCFLASLAIVWPKKQITPALTQAGKAKQNPATDQVWLKNPSQFRGQITLLGFERNKARLPETGPQADRTPNG